MKMHVAVALLLASTSVALAQDQQLGARTKAMGGSYTAFEDDPVSIWLNPAGIATQPTQLSVSYQTYTVYPLHEEQPSGGTSVEFSAGSESSFVDPAVIPSYMGIVFHVGEPESGMALGICYARPYHLNYSFDQVDDPLQTTFTPDSNVEQSFGRFRIALAKDWRFGAAGERTFLTHVAAAVGLDIGYERWEFNSTATNASDNATAFGAGLGLLAGVYDNGESLRINAGIAYQSAMKWDFAIDPDIFPAFDMPQQVNFGFTFYMLKGTPLRATIDLQWVDWSETADTPLFSGRESFEDALNFSIGFEYRFNLSESASLYPRLGYRRFDAPWADEDDLPMTSNFQLVLDTDGEAFNIFTFGAGIAWTSEGGKGSSVDIAAEVGGDSFNFAIGFSYEL